MQTDVKQIDINYYMYSGSYDTTLSITTLSITTLSITALSIKGLCVTLSITTVLC